MDSVAAQSLEWIISIVKWIGNGCKSKKQNWKHVQLKLAKGIYYRTLDSILVNTQNGIESRNIHGDNIYNTVQRLMLFITFHYKLSSLLLPIMSQFLTVMTQKFFIFGKTSLTLSPHWLPRDDVGYYTLTTIHCWE